jgi:hypothetical protein
VEIFFIENSYFLESFYHEITSRYTRLFFFWKVPKLGKCCFLESNNYENYRDGKTLLHVALRISREIKEMKRFIR